MESYTADLDRRSQIPVFWFFPASAIIEEGSYHIGSSLTVEMKNDSVRQGTIEHKLEEALSVIVDSWFMQCRQNGI